MNQNELNRAVARATSETVSTVKRIGFMIMDPSEPVEDPTDPVHGGRVLDWDEFETQFCEEVSGEDASPHMALC